jgi:hypothetical protein
MSHSLTPHHSASQPRAGSAALPARLTAIAALLALAAGASHAAGPVAGQGTWETTLKARDINGVAVALNDASAAFFYDTVADITWQADMNQVAYQTHYAAQTWADNLTTGGFTDWRLPVVIDSGTAGCNFSYAGGTDCGYNVQTQVGGAYSEWAHLFYNTLGNKAYCPPGDEDCGGGPQEGWGLTNAAYFKNLQSSDYWSATVYAPDSGYAWYFGTNYVHQYNFPRRNAGFSVAAVRSGDVLSAVPEAGTGVMAALGLVGLGVAIRRRRSV